MRPACHLDTQNTVFDSLDTQNFRSGFADDDNSSRDVIDSRQIDRSTFSLCQLNRIEWLGIESK